MWSHGDWDGRGEGSIPRWSHMVMSWRTRVVRSVCFVPRNVHQNEAEFAARVERRAVGRLWSW